MASTTANKKQIVDFLWEWAESNGEWSKLLIDKIVSTESNLLPADRNQVFNYFLQSINLHTGLPALTSKKPNYVPTNKVIELETLSDITGVNKLAKNQTLKFSKNITVIYGENGTGKTGYGRILKSLGFSYDPNNTVHPNIYGAVEAKSAIINFKSNGTSQTFNWTGANKDAELQNISVFNNSCVQISLSDRQLIVSPIGFHLFNIVSSELNELTQLLNAKIASHPTTINWADSLHLGTPQQIYISGLSAISTEQKLTELSSTTPAQEQELIDKQTELSQLNKALLQTEIQNLNSSVTELGTIISKIQNSQTNFTSANWQKLIDLNKDITILESKTKTGIKEIAENNGIEFYETPQFQSFIKAAEDYIKVIDKPDYPNSQDTCIYCLQPLEDQAKLLLESYRTLLNDKTQENLLAFKQQKTNLINQVLKIETNLFFHQPTFGIDENQKTIQPAEIIEFNTTLEALKTTFTTDKIIDGSAFSFDYAKYIKFFTDKKTAIGIVLTQKNDLLANLSIKETELKNKISELIDRKLLSTKVLEVKTSIANRKIVATLQSKSSSFSTNSISRKTSDAREQLVEKNFNNLFQAELKLFKKSDLKIELNFGTDKGKSKIWHRLNSSYTLADILSEGEQKAISLAEFLTELQLDNVKAPVIFDDPVNSLDHRIIDEVGKRFIELSKQRQVIIFTHSILLLHSLIQQSELDTNKQANVDFEFHKVKNNFGITGILDEVEEINSFSYYTKKLQAVIDIKPSPDQDEAKLAAEGYGHLRSAIEISVEDDLLKKTVKRYKKGVAFPSLLRIEGSKIDTNKGKVNDIYEKCCVSIDGHSSPEEIHTTPTIAELKVDYEEFKKVRKIFTS
jgi:energy-coupling factor transporter ATP-binding protein EcfA2